MQPADTDPLQFGGLAQEEDDHYDDLPTAYGTSSADELGHHLEPPSAPAAAAAAAHDPLSGAGAGQAGGAGGSGWQHYPAPPAPVATSSAPAAAAGPASFQQQQQQLHGAAYPAVPAPGSTDCSIPLGSPSASSLSGGAHTPTSPAAAVGALALAAAAAGGGAPVAVVNPELRIAVGAPLRHMGPSGIPGLEEAYTTYEVATSTTLPHFSAQRITVRRRFRDFVSLSNLLPKLLHGSLLPARPAKNPIESRRMTDGFIEERRAALERYINRLAAHPAAARSEALRVFLEADGNLRSNPQWRCLKPAVLTPLQATNRLIRTLVGARKTAPTPSEVVQPAAVCRDVYRLVHENVQQLRGSFKHSPISAEESALRDDTVLVEDAAAALHIALGKAEAWSRAASGRAALLGEAAVALEALASFEASYTYGDPATKGALAATGQAMQAASATCGGAAAGSSAVLQPLRDHHAITPNVLAALRGRERQLLTVQTLRHDLEDKRARLSAAQLMPASQAKRVDTLRTQVGQLEVSAAAAEAEYNRQLARNKDELASLRAQRGQELTAMLGALVRLELAQEQQQASLWQQLLQRLPHPKMTTAYMAQRDMHIGPVA